MASFGEIAMARKVCADGLHLIKNAEGRRLEAYPDPATGGDPWTIGYGHTGPDVKPGRVITEEQAEEILIADLAKFEVGVEHLIPGLNDHQFCALVSFAFNVGLGALEESTLRRRILAGEDPATVIAAELPRWVKGNGKPMPGLVTRRKAEIEHALRSPGKAPEAPAVTPRPLEGTEAPSGGAEINLEAFFRHYDHQPHQEEAVHLLQEALKGHPVLQDDHPWVKTYRSGPKEQVKQPPAPVSGTFVQLQVPYLYQLDSEVKGQGGRMCFSSTNAMLVEYLRPGTLRGVQHDDAYLHKVFEYGDTTSAEAQVKALEFYGIQAAFKQNGTSKHAKELLRAGVPVPIGILHHGPISAPSGGGHWMLLVGFDDTKAQWIVHDPYGELNAVAGGYSSNAPTAGRFVRYSYKNLNARWMVHGEGDGWYLEASK